MMKTMIAILALTLSFNSLATSKVGDVLMQVDALLANDSFEDAFKCGDYSEYVSIDEDGRSSLGQSEVENCSYNQVTIRWNNEEESETDVITRSEYLKAKGNPLRIFSTEKLLGGNNFFNWISATPLQVFHLNQYRRALEVTGFTDLCVQSDQEEVCYKVELKITIVQGVPALARVLKTEVTLNGQRNFEALLQNFSRK
jgi:hypothetical protein